jgi:hypothetical protein
MIGILISNDVDRCPVLILRLFGVKMGSKTFNVFDRHAEDYDNWFDSQEGKALFELEVEAVRPLMRGLEKPFLCP